VARPVPWALDTRRLSASAIGQPANQRRDAEKAGHGDDARKIFWHGRPPYSWNPTTTVVCYRPTRLTSQPTRATAPNRPATAAILAKSTGMGVLLLIVESNCDRRPARTASRGGALQRTRRLKKQAMNDVVTSRLATATMWMRSIVLFCPSSRPVRAGAWPRRRSYGIMVQWYDHTISIPILLGVSRGL
jgi:hypothetical protein